MLPLRVAIRYLLSGKAHAATGIITVIATIGIAVTTAALVVVLSVFNGFRDLITDRLSLLDPEVSIVAASGKTIANADRVLASVAAVPGVELAMPVIADKALAVHGGLQTNVVVKGVPDGYDHLNSVRSLMVDGEWGLHRPVLKEDGEVEAITPTPLSGGVGEGLVLGTGPAIRLRAVSGQSEPVALYAPQRSGTINLAAPLGAFRSDTLTVAGVFELSQDGYDTDLVFVPLDVARHLFDLPDAATAIEVKISGEPKPVIDTLRDRLGSRYIVRDRLMQQDEAYRMVNTEKWMSGLLVAFIMLIATFNVIGAMALLIIEKRDDAWTLRAMGATRAFTRRVFISESVLITAAGAISGIALGLLVSLGQQHYGWLKLEGEPGTMLVDAYPVAVQASDMPIVLAATLLIAAVTAAATRLLASRL